MQSPSDRSAPNEKRIGFPASLALVVLVLAILAAFVFYRLETWPGRTAHASTAALERVARDARSEFVRLTHLQPQVTINNRVYFTQTTSVVQLAVLERRVEVEHEMLHSWAGSTKRIRLHGTFAIKAGFDLRKKFSLDVRPGEVVVALPHAEILSVEQKSVEVLALENGFWNRISPNDIEHEMDLLPQLAREQSSALPAEAERSFAGELPAKLQLKVPIQIEFPAPSPAG